MQTVKTHFQLYNLSVGLVTEDRIKNYLSCNDETSNLCLSERHLYNKCSSSTPNMTIRCLYYYARRNTWRYTKGKLLVSRVNIILCKLRNIKYIHGAIAIWFLYSQYKQMYEERRPNIVDGSQNFSISTQPVPRTYILVYYTNISDCGQV